MKIVILANEIGDKLWPLTNAKNPKALLALYSENSMLVETISRCLPLCVNKGKDIYIVSTAESKKVIREQKIHQKFGIPLKNIIDLSPNTDEPALIIGEMVEVFSHLPDEELVCFVPSDQFYWPEEGFVFHLNNTAKGAETNPDHIMFMSMLPGMPAGSMNYINVDWKKDSTVGTVFDAPTESGTNTLSTTMVSILDYRRVLDPGTAEELVLKKWLWDLKTWVSYLKNFRKHITGATDFYEELLPKLILKDVLKATIANKVVWSVLDNWAALKYLTYDAGLFPVKEDPKVHTIDASGNLVKRISDKEIILIGVEDLIVVETEDKLLIATPGGAYEHL